MPRPESYEVCYSPDAQFYIGNRLVLWVWLAACGADRRHKHAVVQGKCEEGLSKLEEQYNLPLADPTGADEHHRVFRFSWRTAGGWGLRVNAPGTPQQHHYCDCGVACFWIQRALADCSATEDPMPRMTFGAPDLEEQMRELLLVELYTGRGEAADPYMVFDSVGNRGRGRGA